MKTALFRESGPANDMEGAAMNTQTVGILGTGRMAVRIADQLVRNGHEVILGSRTPARAQAIAEGLGPHAITAGGPLHGAHRLR
jgi:predicted dinucleotide-binding enzyme